MPEDPRYYLYYAVITDFDGSVGLLDDSKLN